MIACHFTKFILVVVYVPNAGVWSSKSYINGLERLSYRINLWDKDFMRFLKHDLEVANKKPIIVCGDMNVSHNEIDIFKPKDHTKQAGFTDQERESFTELLSYTRLVDTWRYLNPDSIKYSAWSYRSGQRDKNLGWRADYFLSSSCLFTDRWMDDMTTKDAMLDITELPTIVKAEIRTEYKGADHCPIMLEI